MSSEKVLVSNTGRFGVRRIPSRSSRSPCTSNWRQTSTTRSESRSRTPAHKTKTIQVNRFPTSPRPNFYSQKINKAQVMKNKSKLLRIKRKTTVKRPSAPHNTTQYLIDVNNSCQETANLYADQDRFTFDFQHHSMAGSMMGKFFPFSNTLADNSTESFLNRFSKSPAQEQASHPSANPVGNGRPEGMTCREAETQQPVFSSAEKPSFDNPIEIELGNSSYDSYLKKDQNQGNGFIEHLVKIISQKDQEIEALKAQIYPH